jgi:hypothetical protein
MARAGPRDGAGSLTSEKTIEESGLALVRVMRIARHDKSHEMRGQQCPRLAGGRDPFHDFGRRLGTLGLPCLALA